MKKIILIIFCLSLANPVYAVKWPQQRTGTLVRVEQAQYPQCVFLQKGEQEEMYLEAAPGVDCGKHVGKKVKVTIKHEKVKEFGMYGTRDVLRLLEIKKL